MISLKILCIDQATVSGFAFFHDENLMSCGIWDFKKDDLPLCSLYNQVNEEIDSCCPDKIIFENLKTNRNADTIRRLAEFTGVIRLICELRKIPYEEYIPVSVRSKICTIKTGKNGHATKIDLAREICRRFGWSFPIDRHGKEITNEQNKFFNQSDAVALGLYYLLGGNLDRRSKKKDTTKNKD